jgi:hypothetical protein
MKSLKPFGLAILVLGSIGLGGCDPKVHVVAQAASPDKTKIAMVYEEEAVPLVETWTYVYIKPVGRDLDKRRDLVFSGGDMNGRKFGPVNVEWAGNNFLHVGYCSGWTETFRNYWMDGKAQLPQKMEVQLDLEVSGKWPDSTPSDRRAGTPPCI